MSGVSNSKKGLLFLWIFLGAIAGSFIGDALGNSVKGLTFAKNAYAIGTSKPLVLDLKVMAVTFGVNFNVNVMTIIGVVMAIILYRRH